MEESGNGVRCEESGREAMTLVFTVQGQKKQFGNRKDGRKERSTKLFTDKNKLSWSM